MLVAVTNDANNNILPIAFAIVDEETIDSWRWFMEQLRLYVVTYRHPICILSDRHGGIMNVMTTVEEWMEPMVYHRFCLRHVRSNFNKQFKDATLKKKVWALGSVRQKRKWIEIRDEFRALSREGWAYLKEIERSKWCIAYDKNNARWGTLTTNVSESYNNVLRGARDLPITACVDTTFHRTAKLFKKQAEVAANCKYPIPPNIWKRYRRSELAAKGHAVEQFDYADKIFEVTTKPHFRGSGGNQHTVSFDAEHCTCGKWQMYRIPCSHAIAVFMRLNINGHDLVNHYYRIGTFKAQYALQLHPLRHEDYWAQPTFQLKANSRMFTSRRRGRIRASRIRNEMDQRLPGERPRCRNCHMVGHNRRNCPNAQPSS